MESEDEAIIRVGLVRMDTHTMYLGILMDEADPIALRGPTPASDGSFKHGWQAGGTYLYFYQSYREPMRQTIPRVDGFRVTRVWDEDAELAELASRMFRSRPKVCRTLDEVSHDVDVVVIGDCKTEGHDHMTLASPGLRKGVATYVDKPFAYCLKDARAIAEIARRYDAPVMSLSILREAPGLAHFRNRLAEIEPVQLGMIYGCATTRMDGVIHAISASQHVFGGGVRRVQTMRSDDADVIKLDFDGTKDRPVGGVLMTRQGGGGGDVPLSIYAAAIGKGGVIQSQPENDYTHPYGMRCIVEQIKTMVRTRRSPVPMSEMLENIAVADAIRLAHRTGRDAVVEPATEEDSPNA